MDDATIGLIGKRFIERRDVYAEQHGNGSYTPVKRKLGMADLRAHVAGERTLGHYLLSPENRCRLFAFDIDLVKSEVTVEDTSIVPREAFLDIDHPMRPVLIQQMNALGEGLARRIKRMLGDDVTVAAAYSGNKGIHVYGWTESEPAADVQAAGRAVLESFGCFAPVRGDAFWKHDTAYQAFEIELFPKQTTINEGGYGNLMRLALGINLKTGQRGFFLRFDPTRRSELVPMDPAAALNGVLPWV